MDVLSKEIEEAQEKLRAIDGNLASFNGRTAMTLKRRISNEDVPFAQRRSGMEVVSDISGRRDVRNSFDSLPPKRMRDDDDDIEIRKALPSQVVMPAIESKSRTSAISEMRDKEVKEVKQRNRRLFGSLLVGTLQRFQKDEKKVSTAEKAQAEKLAAVEKNLENQKREDREKAMADREKLLNERHQQENALRALQRKRALMQYAEEKTAHYRRLANFIGTKTTPTLFFLPAKHTLQSLEMLKQSSARMQELIEAREAELKKDLEGGGGDMRGVDDDDAGKQLRSHLMRRDSERGDEEDDGMEAEIKDENGTGNTGESSVVPSVEVRMEGEESDGEDALEVVADEKKEAKEEEEDQEEEEPLIE